MEQEQKEEEDDMEDEEEDMEEEEKPEDGLKEKCKLCYKFRGFRFLCSYRHLPSSLDSLVESLKSKCRPFNCTVCTNTQLCQECLHKEKPENVFRHTYKFV